VTCTLIIGQKNYSSWSMRAWLLLRALDVPFDEVTVPLYQPQSRDAVRALGGQTGLVPVLLDGDTAIWDTLAIFEHLYEDHPMVWPTRRSDRARARSISGEIHSGFHALRSAMPVNTRARNRVASLGAEAMADIKRVEEICDARTGDSAWLFRAFGGADIMLAPIATRFQTYGMQLRGEAGNYMDRLLEHPLVAEWLRLGEAETDVIPSLEVGGGETVVTPERDG
jgi:glutathione S-transferase